MSMISAPTLAQARETLINGQQQRLVLLENLREQCEKIADLEQEVQDLATDLSRTRQSLVDAQNEIEALRAQLPDAATMAAYNDLVQFLTNKEETHPELRIAA